ncbi:C-C motif chemokine 23 isoform X2 [Sorex araneus]|uniref:C-C motif chemokine 23 isoform X2 n=1 Tax=Sorex araneus TaxID=42254 RepID=UPI0024339FA9|nr:C-C motif chemokine 23 isoform X2 [Sorex araneus]
MQGSMAAVSLLPLLLLTAIPITLGSQAAVASSSGLIRKPAKGVELSPSPKSPLSNTPAPSKLQELYIFTQPGGPYQPTECCFKFATRVLPLRLIDTFYKTSSQCARPGIIFITKRGNLICANPSDRWVQKHIKNLKE